MADKNAIRQSVKQRYHITGNCDALNRAIDTALKVARVDLSVLILGENGTGKEIMPRIIHDASNRKGRKYLALNCGAIPEGTIDSELFGHVAGAFTGSVGQREGYFAAADGGTLFLDEVGELPLQTQVRLLRVLETGEYIPMGASEPRKTNVRIVAATNVDMHRAIREGRFREDLFYRLAAVTINIPPLRERGRDIDMLFRMFALENERNHMMPPIRLNEEASAMLMHYPWPGNVRQLKNVVDSMSVLCDERIITPEVLARFIPADEQHTQIAPIETKKMPSYSDIPMDELTSLAVSIKMLAKEVEQLKRDVAELKQESKTHHSTANEEQHRNTYLIGHAPAGTTRHVIDDTDLYEEIVDEDMHNTAGTQPTSDAPRTMREIEEEQIRQSLLRNDGNRRKTAKELNLSERTLYRKIKEYGIEK